ncbi:MAG TPA: CoA-binding protein [Bacteroidales bacterium]|nr:CoA-binding protein [Bacteroidales bacterium]
MKKARLAQIEEFRRYRNTAIVGISRNPKKFGFQLAQLLIGQDYNLRPIHPEATEILGLKCIKSVSELPPDTDSIIIVTPKELTNQYLNDALDAGIRQVWIQQFSETPESLATAAQSEANVVIGRCLIMYSNPHGIHRMHARIAKLFGVSAT